MAASGANDMSEKLAALATLRSIEVTIAKQTWKKMAQTAAQGQMSKEAAIIGLKNDSETTRRQPYETEGSSNYTYSRSRSRCVC